MVNFVTALACHFCLALPAAFTQPGEHLFVEPCTGPSAPTTLGDLREAVDLAREADEDDDSALGGGRGGVPSVNTLIRCEMTPIEGCGDLSCLVITLGH